MFEYVLVAGVVGTALAVVDQQNLIPQLSNNPNKKWFFDPSRWTPATPPVTAEQRAIMQQQAADRQRAAAEYSRLHPPSKYALTSVPQPSVIQPYVRPAPHPY